MDNIIEALILIRDKKTNLEEFNNLYLNIYQDKGLSLKDSKYARREANGNWFITDIGEKLISLKEEGYIKISYEEYKQLPRKEKGQVIDSVVDNMDITDEIADTLVYDYYGVARDVARRDGISSLSSIRKTTKFLKEHNLNKEDINSTNLSEVDKVTFLKREEIISNGINNSEVIPKLDKIEINTSKIEIHTKKTDSKTKWIVGLTILLVLLTSFLLWFSYKLDKKIDNIELKIEKPIHDTVCKNTPFIKVKPIIEFKHKTTNGNRK